ncbi:hypothetical protein evm_005372 [Chilo suppressalis]|nr:hypothetical protein evm_005372 [Chilo suppressalis]
MVHSDCDSLAPKQKSNSSITIQYTVLVLGAAAAAAAAAEALGGGGRRAPPPLLRSRTLPAIIAPGFSILHAQIDPQRSNDLTQSQMLCRGVSTHKVGGFRGHAPRISFTNKEESSDPHENRRKSASSRLGSSPRTSIASEDRADGIALRVPTPRGSVSSTSSSTGSRLARLLTQGIRGTPEDLGSETPRRLSWERRESASQLPRSASIDSMVEAAICARHSEPSQSTLQLPTRTDRAFSLASPAVGRRAKSQRGQAAQAYGDLLVQQFPLIIRFANGSQVEQQYKGTILCTWKFRTPRQTRCLEDVNRLRSRCSDVSQRRVEGHIVEWKDIAYLLLKLERPSREVTSTLQKTTAYYTLDFSDIVIFLPLGLQSVRLVRRHYERRSRGSAKAGADRAAGRRRGGLTARQSIPAPTSGIRTASRLPIVPRSRDVLLTANQRGVGHYRLTTINKSKNEMGMLAHKLRPASMASLKRGNIVAESAGLLALIMRRPP